VDTGKKDVGRNDPCPCGSGRKYKNCHLDKDEAAAREARSKAAEATRAEPAPAAESASAPATRGAPPRPKAHGSGAQPWKRGSASARGFQRTSATRKVGGGS
jgi:preprotein translocase subunit SecA